MLRPGTACGHLVVLAVVCGCGGHTRPAPDSGAPTDSGADGGPDAPDCARSCQESDLDGDGAAAAPCGEDCDDADPGVRPGAEDAVGDGRDTDCDGVDGVDRDGDGYLSEQAGGDDCDDSLAVVHPGAPDGLGWVIDWFEAGPRTQLAIDPWGRPVIAFRGWSGELLCHDEDWDPADGTSTVEVTRWRAGGWSRERLDLTCARGKMGLAVTSDTAVVGYTAFAHETGTQLRIGTWFANSPWHVESVDGSHSDVTTQLDRCGDPVIGYTWTQWEDHNLDEVRIARFIGAWTLEPVVHGMAAAGIDLAWTLEGHPALSFSPRVDAERPTVLSYAVQEGPRWSVDEVDRADCALCLYDTSLDLSDVAHGEAAVVSDQGLWVLQSSAGNWRRTTVDPEAIHNYQTWEEPTTVSLAIDASGTSHIAYATTDSVRYATDRSGAWTTEQVGPSFGWVGGWPSLALDRTGGVHVAWYVHDEEEGSDLPPQSGRYALLSRPNDGIDQNCDGIDGEDADGDRHASRQTGGDDPDDEDPSVP